MLLNPRQMPIGMENYNFEPFSVVYGPSPDHDPLCLLYTLSYIALKPVPVVLVRLAYHIGVYLLPFPGYGRLKSDPRFTRIARPPPSPPLPPPPPACTKHYIYECPSGTSFFFFIRQKSSLSKVVKPCYSARTLDLLSIGIGRGRILR